jgi:Ethylbenzene dehydrogenase/Prokaryotic cytochrome b561
MSATQPPKTDLGTIVIHWLIASSLLVCAVTGLSIACADNPELFASRYFGFLLPGEEVWYYHLVFGVILFSSVLAYAAYIRRANLVSRIALPSIQLTTFLRGRTLFTVLNVLLYWLLFAALASALITGFLLLAGWGEYWRRLHLNATWFFLGFFFFHPLLHWLYGGKSQLTRIFRPRLRLPKPAPELVDALIERVQQLETEKSTFAVAAAVTGGGNKPEMRKAITVLAPLAFSAAAGAGAFLLCVSFEKASRETLKIIRVSPGSAPAIDGELSDAVWRKAPPATVLTQHGANFDGGESRIEVRAIHDGTFAYFTFIWHDPTRSFLHMPLVKREDGWHLMRSAGPGNETKVHEDKFAVLLAPGGRPLIGNGIHLGHKPVPGRPAGATGRGLHFIVGGSAEVWQWRASHGGMLGFIDHGHFSAPLPASATSVGGRYTGGFSLDGGPLPYRDNFEILTKEETSPRVRPHLLPSSAARILKLAALTIDPEKSDDRASSPWLTPSDSVPYSEEVDGLIPPGAVIPSIILFPDLIKDAASAGITGGAHWASGRWSLEVRRRLDTGNPSDTVIKTGALMWVAAFDHAETWHTYHIRPVKLEVE